MRISDETMWLDASAQGELVRRGEVSAVELVDAAIERIEELNPALNAVIHPLFDKAHAAVAAGLRDGPFQGVPLVLKDFGARSAGDLYHEGTRFLRDVAWMAAEDDHVVSLLRRAGFVIVGRTNVPELASTATTEPDAYGPTHNPWDLARSSGGSSGGSAAAVAAGLVALGHGTDGGGSIRIPASACGLVGLKPSRGRVSWGPSLGESGGGLAANFALTRSVRDTAALLDLLAAPGLGDPYAAPGPARPFREIREPRALRVGLRTDPTAMSGGTNIAVHPECTAAAESTATLLETFGHSVERGHPRPLDEEDLGLAMSTVWFSTVARGIEYWGGRLGRPLGPDDVNSDNWTMFEMGRATSAPTYIAALDRIHEARLGMARWWAEGFDVLLTPTLAQPPPLLGELRPDPAAPLAASIRSIPLGTFTIPWNMSGQPAISLPLGWTTGGLPIGIQLVAAYGREDVLLDVAAQLERAKPWLRHPEPAG